MVDCFVATLDLTPGRIDMSRRVLKKLREEPGLRLTLMDAGSTPGQLAHFRESGFNLVPHPKEGSAHRRYLLAEALATSHIYFLFDDDCIPKTEDWLFKALDAMENHSRFGLIGLRKETCDYAFTHGFQDSQVRCVQSVGGCMAIRRGVRTKTFRVPLALDHKLNRNNDSQYCQAIRESGSEIGQFEQVYFEHLDKGGQETVYRKELLVE